MRFHGPAAVVNGENHLEAVFEALLKDNFNLTADLYGPGDRLVNIDPVPGASRYQFLESFQGFANSRLG